MANPHEALARLTKATALADAIAAEHITADQVADFDAFTWSIAAAKAGVKPPNSDETRELVISILRRREALEVAN